MNELIERARSEVELRKAMHGDDRSHWSRSDRMMADLLAALDAARKDSERLDWLASECIPEGFVHVESDVYEYACEVAGENGRDEPIDADHFAGYRRMIDAALAPNEDGIPITPPPQPPAAQPRA